MFDSGKPLVKATDWWRSAYPTLWYRDLSELWSHMYGKLKEKRLQCRCYSARKQFEDFLWISLWSPRPCCFSPGFLWVKINVTVQTDIQKNKSKKLPLKRFKLSCILQMIALILSNSRFLFRNKLLHYWLEKKICSSHLHSESQYFFDNLLIDNIACSRRSVGKTRCTVNGAIVTAERKKSEAWFHRVKNNVLLTRSVPIWTRPDPTRHKPPRYFTSRLLSCHVPFRSVLLNESLVMTTAAKYELCL